MNVLSGEKLAKAIRQIFLSRGELNCAVAFWGPNAGAQAAKRSARWFSTFSMGGTSRNALKALGVPSNRNIRVLDRLHAKIHISKTTPLSGLQTRRPMRSVPTEEVRSWKRQGF